jgi:hypothetical protein
VRYLYGICIVIVFIAVAGFTFPYGPVAQMIGLLAVVFVGYTGWALIDKEGK